MSARDGSGDPRLDVSLLGRCVVLATDGREVRLPGRHAQALLAILVIARRPRTREAIAVDLWPEALHLSTGPLRQALYQLRQALTAAGLDPDGVLESDAESLALRSGAVATLDIDLFEACIADPGCGAAEAIRIYGGDLVEGLGHECFVAERERLADRYEDALADLAAQRLAEGDLASARTMAERLVVRDPLREEAHAILIAVHGLVGSRSQVVRQYRRVREILARELGEVPLPETDAVYRRAMDGTVRRSMHRATEMERSLGAELKVVARG